MTRGKHLRLPLDIFEPGKKNFTKETNYVRPEAVGQFMKRKMGRKLNDFVTER